MNTEHVLTQVVNEALNGAIFQNWKFYLLILGLSFLGCVAGSYVRSYSGKRGEVAALKADTENILSHLKITTAATKEIEIALSHGDWVRKEQNMLKRVKLEELLVSAYAISAWTSQMTSSAFGKEQMQTDAPIDRFEMLYQLYFPDLAMQSLDVGQRYREARVAMSDIRTAAFSIHCAYEVAVQQGDSNKCRSLLSDLKKLNEENSSTATDVSVKVYKAVQELTKAARKQMDSLTQH